jgi:hypothetical protein
MSSDCRGNFQETAVTSLLGKISLNDPELCALSVDSGRKERSSALVTHYSIWSCGRNDLQEKSHPAKDFYRGWGKCEPVLLMLQREGSSAD